MSANINLLLDIQEGTPLSSLRYKSIRTIPDYYKIDEHIYLNAFESHGDGIVRYCGFIWVASKGVAEWIFTRNGLADDNINREPPKELLPENRLAFHPDVVAFGRKIDAEHFRDSVWGPRVVQFGDYQYYYRYAEPRATDYPIAIEVDRRPSKYDRLG